MPVVVVGMFVEAVGKSMVVVGIPLVTVGMPMEAVGRKPVVAVGKPVVAVGMPVVVVGMPVEVVRMPVEVVRMPVVAVGKSVVAFSGNADGSNEGVYNDIEEASGGGSSGKAKDERGSSGKAKDEGGSSGKAEDEGGSSGTGSSGTEDEDGDEGRVLVLDDEVPINNGVHGYKVFIELDDEDVTLSNGSAQLLFGRSTFARKPYRHMITIMHLENFFIIIKDAVVNYIIHGKKWKARVAKKMMENSVETLTLETVVATFLPLSLKCLKFVL